MSQRTVAGLLLAGGVLAFLVALSADSLGLGASPGLGLKQIALAAAGVVIAAIGISKLRARP